MAERAWETPDLIIQKLDRANRQLEAALDAVISGAVSNERPTERVRELLAAYTPGPVAELGSMSEHERMRLMAAKGQRLSNGVLSMLRDPLTVQDVLDGGES